MGAHGPSVWMFPGQGWALWMDAPRKGMGRRHGLVRPWALMAPWALEIIGLLHGWALGMDELPSALEMDEP